MQTTILSLLALLQPAEAALPDGALAAMRRGDCSSALILTEELETLEAALARARCGAPDGLEDHLGGGGALEGYARLLIARSQIDDAPEAVATTLEGVSLPGAAGLEVRLLRGRSLIAQGRSLDARPDLRALLETDVGAEARYWLAWGAQQRGDDDAAIQTYAAVWSRYVTSPFSARAADRLAELGAPAPDFSTEAGRSLAKERADQLIKAYRAPEAIPLLDGIGAATGDTSSAWRHALGMALFKAKDYPRAVETLALLNPESATAYGGAETLYHFALGTSRTGDYAAAAASYARLYALYPDHQRADTASYKVGYLDYDAGRLEDALPHFTAHLQRYPGSRHADETRWFTAWSLLRLGRLDEAEAALETLLAKHSGSSLAPAGLYWKARIRGMQGDESGQTEALERLLRSYPSSGYAWFAAERLGRTFEGMAEPVIPALPASFVDARPDLGLALTLAGAGQFEWAREAMSPYAGEAKAAGKDTALAFAHALIDVGAYKDAQSIARGWCTSPWKGGDPVAMAACYPRPEHAVVHAAASERGLPPLLPYAIMTAESALDPSVTSPAGARGLMQLMPHLAEELHAELLPDSAYDADRLYDPGYNAWLGTTELGQLAERYVDQDPALPMIIAGYNGGSEAVDRWLAADPDAEFDLWSENVGYTETRRYVKRVLGFLMNYRWIYGDG